MPASTRRHAVKDLEIEFEHRVGTLADMGEALGRAGVSIEGGGAFAVPGGGLGHFLVEDAAAARAALEGAGIRVVAEHDVITLRLRQDEPGQLGKLTRRMAEAGVSIDVLYSDHANRLILVVDDLVRGRQVSEAWTGESPDG
jgi:hypothetical protein